MGTQLAVLVATTYELKARYVHKLVATYDGRVDPWLPLVLALLIGVPLYALKRRSMSES